MDFELYIHEVYIFKKDSSFEELKEYKESVEVKFFCFLIKSRLLLSSEPKKKKKLQSKKTQRSRFLNLSNNCRDCNNEI